MPNQIMPVNDGYPINDRLDVFIARNKTTKSRVNRYFDWCASQGIHWASPSLKGYRDHLLTEGLAPRTIHSVMSTIRSVYSYIITDNDFRAWLMNSAPSDDFIGAKAYADEVITRIENETNPDALALPTVTVQDRADSDFVRLSPAQVHSLCEIALSQGGLVGLRDNAMIRTMVYTGVRESELVALDTDDLRQTLDGHLALRVRLGKGRKQRLIPYGKFEGEVLPHIYAYHREAGILEGAVFRGIKRNGKTRTRRIGVSSVGYILDGYRLPDVPHFTPHDLRRTYARRLYNEGVPVEGIKANMGHTSVSVTWHYIGTVDVGKRVP